MYFLNLNVRSIQNFTINRDGDDLPRDKFSACLQRSFCGQFQSATAGNFQETHQDDTSAVSFSGTLCCEGKRTIPISGQGNGPIDAFFNAVHGQDLDRYTFVDYKEHAINTGSDSQAVAYIHLRIPDGTDVFGVGMDHNISMASIKGVLSAINRAKKLEAKKGA